MLGCGLDKVRQPVTESEWKVEGEGDFLMLGRLVMINDSDGPVLVGSGDSNQVDAAGLLPRKSVTVNHRPRLQLHSKHD